MNKIILIAATILLIINTFWGLYMRIFVIPKWFSNLPTSFSSIRTIAPKGWMPLDELRFSIHPVFVGRGKLLFRDGEEASLKLVATKTRGNGVVVLSYQPVGA